jgi:hypothetical protein
MYAVVGMANLAPERMDEIVEMADSQVIPLLKSQAGHVASCFTRNAYGTNGMSISVFVTKEQAEASAASMNTPPRVPVSIENVEVREVIASG